MSRIKNSKGVEDVPMTPDFPKFKLWPGGDCEPNQSIALVFVRPLEHDAEVKVQVIHKGCSLTLDASRLNSLMYNFNVKDIVDGMKTIEVLVNNSSYGRAQLYIMSKMEQLWHRLGDVTDAPKLLCQSMNCETMEDLDLELLDLLSNYWTSDMNRIFSTFNWNKFGGTVSKSELPTILHFGAKFGLLNFCRHLINLPGGQQAMQMKNKNNLLPTEIAKENGFDSLASTLSAQHECSSASFSSRGNDNSCSFLRSSSGSDIVPRGRNIHDERSTESGRGSGSTLSSKVKVSSNRMTMLLDKD